MFAFCKRLSLSLGKLSPLLIDKLCGNADDIVFIIKKHVKRAPLDWRILSILYYQFGLSINIDTGSGHIWNNFLWEMFCKSTSNPLGVYSNSPTVRLVGMVLVMGINTQEFTVSFQAFTNKFKIGWEMKQPSFASVYIR